MDPNVLIIIKSDPQLSHRPVEAIRMGLGFRGGDLPVTFILLNEAPRLLGPDSEDLVDGEILQKYLPTLGELGQTFHVEEKAAGEDYLEGSDYELKPVSSQELRRMLETNNRFFVM